MELKIAVCDDEPISLNEICGRVQQVAAQNAVDVEIHKFINGQDLIQASHALFHVVLLDIDMPVTDGFQIAAALQETYNNITVVFITNHEDKVFQSYEYHPFWFVRKNRIEELNIVLKKLFKKLESEYTKNCLYVLKTEKNDFTVDFTKIMYFESYKHYVNVHGMKGYVAEIRCKISEIAEQLLPFHFVRLQAGFVVNCRFISKVTSRHLFLSQGDIRLHINRDRLDDVRAAFQKYMRSERDENYF